MRICWGFWGVSKNPRSQNRDVPPGIRWKGTPPCADKAGARMGHPVRRWMGQPTGFFWRTLILLAMKNPPHPGDFIRTEILEPAGLTVTAAAAALKVSRSALSSLLNGKASLSGDMALRIEKAFGVRMETLMRMQSSFDIAETRKREGQIHLRRVAVLATAQ